MGAREVPLCFRRRGSPLITCQLRPDVSARRNVLALRAPPSAAPPPAAAQSTLADNAPPLLGTVMPLDANGTIVVRPEGHVTATGHTPLTIGDIVRTGVNASAMIVLANHTILLMLERTEIEMRGPSRLRLSDGYVTVILDEWPRLLSLPMPDNGALLTVDVPHGVIALTAAGDYDLDVEARTPATSSALVTVHAGLAQLTALKTDVDGRDSLDRVDELSLGRNQAGLLRAGTIPVMMPPTLSPHRVATDDVRPADPLAPRLPRARRRRRCRQLARGVASLLVAARWIRLVAVGRGVWADVGAVCATRVAALYRRRLGARLGVRLDVELARTMVVGRSRINLGRWRTDRFYRWVWHARDVNGRPAGCQPALRASRSLARLDLTAQPSRFVRRALRARSEEKRGGGSRGESAARERQRSCQGPRTTRVIL